MPATLPARPGLTGLVAFCKLIDEPLLPHERRIAKAYFGPAREVCAILPRGNAKTTVAAKIAVHHLITVEGAAVTIGAASVAQARIAFERMRGFAQHPALGDAVVVRYLELRHADGDGLLRVVPAAGPRVHGLSSTLYIGDEVWSWPDAGLLEAMQTGLVKRPDSKLLAISTAAANLDSPLGRMRARALAQPTAKRTGAVVEATGDLHWLEWSLADDQDLDDLRAVKRANPAPWIKVADLRRQRSAVPDLAFQQFHACRWGLSEGSWLPAGAWQACIGEPVFTDGEPIWVGVDVGGERSASAVVWVNAALSVGCAIYHGDAGVLECVEQVRELAGRYRLREVVYDPWRFGQAAQELARERVPVVEFPQNDTRMCPASVRLHAAIVEKRLTLPDDAELAQHAAHTVARHSRRGWRVDKAGPRDNMDGIVALCMALERAEQPAPAPARLVGWL
ncbi:MAG: terminase TerL endonuclease subunit [Solirubrobacteraceae bacterium]